LIDGKHRIWDESVPSVIKTPMTKKDFLDALQHIKLYVQTGKDVKRLPIAQLWLDFTYRRHYHEIVFDPSFEHDPNSGVCNLWRGFAYKPKKGNCWRFLRYIRDIICGGNRRAIAGYALGWRRSFNNLTLSRERQLF
jgi:hypothetical protein